MKRWVCFLLHLPLMPVSDVHSHPTFSKNLAKETAHALNSILQPELATPLANICHKKLRGKDIWLLQSQQQNLFPEFITWDLQCCFYWGVEERGTSQAKTVPSASKGYFLPPFMWTSQWHGDRCPHCWKCGYSIKTFTFLFKSFLDLQNRICLLSHGTGIYSRGLEVKKKKKSFPSLTPSLLAPSGGSKETCTVKLLLFVFIYLTIYLGFKLALGTDDYGWQT